MPIPVRARRATEAPHLWTLKLYAAFNNTFVCQFQYERVRIQ
jgi:hypothetical protein